jgi:hypothetical protein|tara:strand:+ start:129 stop:332 length:204 start_codon:yes stop_codon:yes gene_type:complete
VIKNHLFLKNALAVTLFAQFLTKKSNRRYSPLFIGATGALYLKFITKSKFLKERPGSDPRVRENHLF